MGYKFTRYELDLLRMYPKSKRESIRRMTPQDRYTALSGLAFLDDDLMIELGAPPRRKMKCSDIHDGMILRNGQIYRIILEIDRCWEEDNEGTTCVYAEYKPNCVFHAINPNVNKMEHELGELLEVIEWAKRVVTCSWEDKIMFSNKITK